MSSTIERHSCLLLHTHTTDTGAREHTTCSENSNNDGEVSAFKRKHNHGTHVLPLHMASQQYIHTYIHTNPKYTHGK
jgi:hypothetical protein